jgi:hypothetical protein
MTHSKGSAKKKKSVKTNNNIANNNNFDIQDPFLQNEIPNDLKQLNGVTQEGLYPQMHYNNMEQLSQEGHVFTVKVQSLLTQPYQDQSDTLTKLGEWIQEFREYNTSHGIFNLTSSTKVKPDFQIILEATVKLVKESIAESNCILLVLFLDSLERNFLTSSHPQSRTVTALVKTTRVSLVDIMLKYEDDRWLDTHRVLTDNKALERFILFLKERCRVLNLMETNIDIQLFIRSMNWQNYLIDYYTIGHYVSWNDVWYLFREVYVQKTMLIHALTPSRYQWHPKPLSGFDSIAHVLQYSSSVDIEFLQQVLQLMLEGSKFNLLKYYGWSKRYMFQEIIIPIIQRGFSNIDQFRSVLHEMLKMRPGEGFFEPIFDSFVKRAITSEKHRNEMVLLCSAFITDTDFTQYLVGSLARYQYETKYEVDRLLEIIVHQLTDDQIQLLVLSQIIREEFIPVVIELGNRRNNTDWAIQYIAKCASTMYQKVGPYNTYGSTAITFLRIINSYHYYNVVPSDDSKNFLNTWMSRYGFTASVMQNHASYFIEKFVLDVVEWNDDNLCSLIIERLCNDYCRYIDVKETLWLHNLQYANSYSRQRVLLLLYRVIYQIGKEKRIPDTVPQNVVNSDPVIKSLIKEEFKKFNDLLESNSLTFREWDSIYMNVELFSHMSLFVTGSRFCKGNVRLELFETYSIVFEDLEKLNSILYILVKRLHVNASEELRTISQVYERKEELPLAKLIDCSTQIRDTLKPLLDIGIHDIEGLYAVLSSKLFSTRYSGLSRKQGTSVKKAALMINEVIRKVKELLTTPDTPIEHITLETIVLLDSFNADLARECKFLEKINCGTTWFVAAAHLYIREQMLQDLKYIAQDEEMGFHQTMLHSVDFDRLFQLCDHNVVLRNVVDNLKQLRLITRGTAASDDIADKKVLYAWPIFSYVRNCRELYMFCSIPANRPDEAMKQIILQKLAEYESTLFHNYYECITLLKPFMIAKHSDITIDKFFDLICELNIQSVDAAKQFQCLSLCNGQKERETIKDMFAKATRDEQTIAERADEILKTGIFKITLTDLSGCQFEVRYSKTISNKVRHFTCSQHEFVDMLNNAMFKRDKSDTLRKFSDNASQLLIIFERFSKLKEIGHVAFQNQVIQLSMNNYKSLADLTRKLPDLTKNWEDVLSEAYQNCKHLISFTTKQILLLSQYIGNNKKDDEFYFYQILSSCFTISKEQVEQVRQITTEDVSMKYPNYNWEMFETTKTSVHDHTAKLFEVVGNFLNNCADMHGYDVFKCTISPNVALEQFHDISNLDQYNQALYLISLSKSSRDILMCNSSVSEVELSFKLRIHEKMSTGRLVVFGVDRLSATVRSVLTNYLLKINKNTEEKQIICLILNPAIRNMLPTFVIHMVQSLPTKVIVEQTLQEEESKKFKSIEYFDHPCGSGKTYSIHKRMSDIPSKAHLVINLNNSTTLDDIIRQASKVLHTNRTGAIYFNISHDVNIDVVNQILFEFLVLGSVMSPGNGSVLCVPNYCKMNWQVFIEVPEEMSPSLFSIKINGRRGVLRESFDLSARDIDTISFIHHVLNGNTGNELLLLRRNKYQSHYACLPPDLCRKYLHSLIRNKCKNIPQTSTGGYSFRMMSQFMAFMADKCLNWLKKDVQYEYNEVFGRTLPETYVMLFLHEADNFLNPQVQHNTYIADHPYIYSIKSANGSISVVPFKNADSVQYADVTAGFTELERKERLEIAKQKTIKTIPTEYKQERILNREYMKIDYKLVEYLANALGAKEKQVTSILDRHNYVLIPEYLHKLIQINQRLRIKLPSILEGDSGVGKTKLAEIYADIMTSSHCDIVTDFQQFLLNLTRQANLGISDKCKVTKIVDNQEKQEVVDGYLYNIFNQEDHKVLFDVILDILNLATNEFKEQSIKRLCNYSKELFYPIFDRALTEEDRAIKNNCKTKLDTIHTLELQDRVKILCEVIKEVSTHGRAYLSSMILSKFTHVIRTEIAKDCETMMITENMSLATYLTDKLNKDIRVEAIMSYMEYTLNNCQRKNQLLEACITQMNGFISIHPLLNPSPTVVEYIINSKRDYSLFLQVLREYLTMEKHSPFFSVLMHSGLSPKDIYEQMKAPIKLAEDTLKHEKCSICGECVRFVGFIDEANTTKYMGMLSRLLVDHSWSEFSHTDKLPSNISWVCAINPFDNNEDVSKRRFNVQKESPSMKYFKFFWDQLDEIQLKEYIQEKIYRSKVLFSLNLTASIVNALLTLIIKSHQYVAKVIHSDELRSTVSQRDIHRLFQLFEWFYTRDDMKSDPNRPNLLNFSVLMSIAFCYYFRLKSERREEFSRKIAKWTHKCIGISYQLTDLVNSMMDHFVSQMEIPSSIFKNYALKQNMFTLMVCIENRIPITLIGPPGCSKTLSLQIVQRNMGRKGFMSTFQIVDSVHRYQGSRQSTSEEIEKVCIKAAKIQQFYDDSNLKKLSLFFFDEAGIPESEKESLKVLHYYLNSTKFPAVLITNDPLDVAKSNRGIEVLLAKPDEGDLTKLAEGIIKRHQNDELTSETQRLLAACCRAYKSLISDNNSNTIESKTVRNWIGMRDFYHLVRFIRRKCTEIIEITPTLLLQGLERNFNGLKQSVFRKIVTEFFKECGKENKEFLTAQRNYRLNLDILKDSLCDINRGQDNGNLNDTCVRFKLLVDETLDDSLSRILTETGVVDQSKIEELSLSNFSNDKNDVQRILLVSKIIAAMETGKTILLTNTRSIDGSFYDLYNQYYQVTKNENNEYVYFTTIAVGAVSEYRKVHKDFQCIIHIRSSEVKSLEPALLNRFEKFTISTQDALLYNRRKLSKTQNNNLDIVLKSVKTFTEQLSMNYNNVIFSSDIESTTASLVLSTITPDGKLMIPSTWSWHNATNTFKDTVDTTEHKEIRKQRVYLQALLIRLMQIIRPEGFIQNLKSLPREYLMTYFKDQKHLDMKEFFTNIIERCDKDTCNSKCFKYMVYSPIAHIQDCIPKDKCVVINLDEIQSRESFIETCTKFCQSHKNLLVLQVTDSNVSDAIVQQIRTIIDAEISKVAMQDKKAFIVLSTFRQDRFASGIPSLFLSGWEHYYVDGTSNNDLVRYILDLFSDSEEPVVDHDGEWLKLEKLFALSLRKLILPSDMSSLKEYIDPHFLKLYDNSTKVDTRAAILKDIFSKESMAPFRRNMVDMSIVLSTRAFRLKLIQKQARAILENTMHVDLANNIKISTTNGYAAFMAKILHMLLQRLYILSLWKLTEDPDINTYLSVFINIENLGSIDELVNNLAENKLQIHVDKFIPSLPFSHEIITHVNELLLLSKAIQSDESLNNSVTLLQKLKNKISSSTSVVVKAVEIVNQSSTLRQLLINDIIENSMKHLSTDASSSNHAIMEVARIVLFSLHSHIFDGAEPCIESVLVLCHTERERLEMIVTSIKPLVDFGIVNEQTLGTLKKDLDKLFALDRITECIDTWMLQETSRSISNILDGNTQPNQLIKWCLCTNAVFNRTSNSKRSCALLILSSLLRYSEVIPSVEQCLLLKKLLDKNYTVQDLVNAVRSIQQTPTCSEEKRRSIISAFLRQLVTLYKIEQKQPYLRLILEIINGTHELDGTVTTAMGGYILSGLLYDSTNKLQQETLSCIYATVFSGTNFTVTEYLPIFFTAEEEPKCHDSLPVVFKSKLGTVLYNLEVAKMNAVPVGGLINRMNNENSIISQGADNAKVFYSLITIAVIKNKLVEIAGRSFAEGRLLEVFQMDSIRFLEDILKSNKNYQLSFLQQGQRSLTRKEFTSLMLAKDNGLQGLGMDEWIRSVVPVQLQSNNFSFMQENTHIRYQMYRRLRILFSSVCDNLEENSMNKLLTFLEEGIHLDKQNVYHFRMFLVCIAHREYYKIGTTFTNAATVLEQLDCLKFTENERTILLCLLDLSTLNNSQSCIAIQLRNVDDRWSDNIFNLVALSFGIPQGTYIYNLLFNIQSFHNNRIAGDVWRRIVQGGTQHRGFLDCGTKLDQNGNLQSGQPKTLGVSALYLLYFLTFGFMAIQLQFMPDSAFPVLHSHIFSRTVDEEVAPDDMTKLSQFILARTNANWLHLWSRTGLTLDQSQRLITLFVEELQESALSGNAEMTLQVLNSEENVEQFEVFFQDRFNHIYNNKPLLNIPQETDDRTCLDVVDDFCKRSKDLLYLPDRDQMNRLFNATPENAQKYPVLALYMQNKERFELSSLLCYCAELYVWISTTLNGLLHFDDMQRPLKDIIARYRLKEASRGDMLLALLKKLVDTWNTYIDIYNGFQFECHIGEVREKLTHDVQLQLLLSVSDLDKKTIDKQLGIPVEGNRMFAAIRALAQIHNEQFVTKINEHLEQMGYPPNHSEINMYVLNSTNAEQFMFQTEQDFENIFFSHFTGYEQVDFSSLQDQILSTRMLLKPTIVISDEIDFKFRAVDSLLASREQENMNYMTSVPADFIQPIDDRILAQIEQQYHDLDRQQILDVIDALKKAIDNNTMDFCQVKLKQIIRDVTGVAIEGTILDLDLAQAGTVLQLFIDKSVSMEYNYRQLPYDVKKKLPEKQLEILEKKLHTMDANDDIVTLLQQFQNTMLLNEPYIANILERNIPIVDYFVELAVMEETDLMTTVFAGITVHYYVAIQQFVLREMVHFIRLKTSGQVMNVVWREFDTDIVIHIEEEEQKDWYKQVHIHDEKEEAQQTTEKNNDKEEQQLDDPVETDDEGEETTDILEEEEQIDGEMKKQQENNNSETPQQWKVTLQSEGLADHHVVILSYANLRETIAKAYNRSSDDILSITAVGDDVDISDEDDVNYLDDNSVLAIVFQEIPVREFKAVVRNDRQQSTIEIVFSTYDALVHEICTAFKQLPDDIEYIYDQTEGDSIAIESNEDLQYLEYDAIQIEVKFKIKVIPGPRRLILTDGKTNKKRDVSSYQELRQVVVQMFGKQEIVEIKTIIDNRMIQCDNDLYECKLNDKLIVIFK